MRRGSHLTLHLPLSVLQERFLVGRSAHSSPALQTTYCFLFMHHLTLNNKEYKFILPWFIWYNQACEFNQACQFQANLENTFLRYPIPLILSNQIFIHRNQLSMLKSIFIFLKFCFLTFLLKRSHIWEFFARFLSVICHWYASGFRGPCLYYNKLGDTNTVHYHHHHQCNNITQCSSFNMLHRGSNLQN